MPDTRNGQWQLQEPLARGEASSCGNWGLCGGETEARGGCALLCPLCAPQAVTWCQGSVFLEGQQPTVELSCEKAPATVRRGWNGSMSPGLPGVPQVPTPPPHV